jgi:hypothetical protein
MSGRWNWHSAPVIWSPDDVLTAVRDALSRSGPELKATPPDRHFDWAFVAY